MNKDNKYNSIATSLPKQVMDLIDEIVKKNPYFKNRTGLIKYAVRRYYDELVKMKKV